MKNKNTFAARAKALQNKYSRASFDPIEAQELESEMEKLMLEQETFRQKMGMGNPQEMKCGGKMKYDTGGEMPFYLRAYSEPSKFSPSGLNDILNFDNETDIPLNLNGNLLYSNIINESL